MKKLLGLAVLFTGMSIATFAQENGATSQSTREMRKKPRMEKRMEQRTPEKIAEMRTEQLSKRLTLTEKQRSDIYAIQLEQAKKMSVLRGDRKDQQNKWREEMKSSQDKMKEILSPEQQQQLKESYAERRRSNISNQRREFPKREKMNKKAPASEIPAS